MTALRPFGDGIWVCDGPRVRMMTIPFATRMTLVELSPGVLWVCSPLRPEPAMQAEVEALGDVRYVIAPNKIHSLGVAPWKARYADAEVWASPRFRDRHPDTPVDRVLGQVVPEAWDGEIEPLCFEGSAFLDEVVFFHRRSRSLIVTDLIQRHEPREESWFWRIVKGSVGVLGPTGGTARDLQRTFRDRDAARASAEAILGWDFDRVAIAHGACITEDAHRFVEHAFAWAVRRSTPEARERATESP